MNRTIEYNISSEWEDYKIITFLQKKGYTKQSIVALKKMPESVIVNGKWEYLSCRLKAGDILKIQITETDSSPKIPPVNIPINIVYEDEDILVVDKSADMPIHPSMNNYDNTLGNAVAYYYASKNEAFVFRCINRLDRDTSGLTILAKHQIASGILYAQMLERKIYREYIAIVENGACSNGRHEDSNNIPDSGTIDIPIGRKMDSAIERMVDPENGERAVTHYKTLDRKNGKALLALHLDTGRTHQIRVHMRHIGHPLIGDWLYNPKNHDMDRQALHSHILRFVHPITGEEMEFTSEIPKDMMEAFYE